MLIKELIKVFALLIFSFYSFSQNEIEEEFYKVTLVPFSVESTDVIPRELTTNEINYISELRQEFKIVVVDLDLYTRVSIYPRNKIQELTIKE